MTKKSINRRLRDQRAAGVAPAPNAPRIAPVQTIHPMFKNKLVEIAKDDEERARAEGMVPVWDDLNASFVKAHHALVAPAVIGQYAARKDIIAFVADKLSLRLRIEQFQRELSHLRAELKGISSQHTDKTGSTNDPDEIMLAVRIGEQYALFLERLESIIQPTVAHIIEIFTQAEMLMIDAQNKAKEGLSPEQDPNVVTDVQVTEIASGAAAVAAEATQ